MTENKEKMPLSFDLPGVFPSSSKIALVIIRYLYPPGLGAITGGVTAASYDWKHPVLVGSICAVCATLIIEIIKLFLDWHKTNRASADKIAQLAKEERQQLLENKDKLRVEQAEYYKALIGDLNATFQNRLDNEQQQRHELANRMQRLLTENELLRAGTTPEALPSNRQLYDKTNNS